MPYRRELQQSIYFRGLVATRRRFISFYRTLAVPQNFPCRTQRAHKQLFIESNDLQP